MVIVMYRILIIEDDMGIAEAIQVQARMWNLDAVYVRNFRNVMEEFSAFEPHLVLLDITLPFYNKLVPVSIKVTILLDCMFELLSFSSIRP